MGSTATVGSIAFVPITALRDVSASSALPAVVERRIGEHLHGGSMATTRYVGH
jgi:hypothetical protein